MARRTVTANDILYTVSPLGSPTAANRHCALLTANLVDETTGRAPRAALTVSLTKPLGVGASVRVVEPGVLVVSGKAQPAFVPQLALTGEIDVTIQASGFIDRDLTTIFACKLRALAVAGSGNTLTLDTNAGLTAGQRLLISTSDGSRVEFAVVLALGPGANQVTLTDNLNSPYPVGSPAQPLPPDLTVELHRAPTMVSGRILKRTGAVIAPLANATVRISKLWRQAPPAGATVAPEPPVAGGPIPAAPWDPPVAGIRPPCYADVTTAASVEFEDRPIDGTMPAKTLLDDVPPGATEIRFSDATNLNVNDVVAIDADDDGRREILEVAAINLSGSAADWATISVGQPLALSHVAGRIVRRLGAPVGPTVALNYAALAGDSALLFDTTGITGSHQVRIVDPGPPIVHSYHRLYILAATSDANGFYRLPPLSRAGKVEVAAKDSGSAAHNEVELVPDYTVTVNPLDVLVS